MLDTRCRILEARRWIALVTVGMPEVGHLPHRFRRVLLTHRAPTSGNNVPSSISLLRVRLPF